MALRGDIGIEGVWRRAQGEGNDPHQGTYEKIGRESEMRAMPDGHMQQTWPHGPIGSPEYGSALMPLAARGWWGTQAAGDEALIRASTGSPPPCGERGQTEERKAGQEPSSDRDCRVRHQPRTREAPPRIPETRASTFASRGPLPHHHPSSQAVRNSPRPVMSMASRTFGRTWATLTPPSPVALTIIMSTRMPADEM